MKKSDFEKAMELISESYPSVSNFIKKIIEKNEKLVNENVKLKTDNNNLRRCVEMYYSFISGGSREDV